MAGNKDGKDVGVPHEESQLQDSETNPPFEESQQLEDSQQDVEPPSQPNLSLPDSQETLKLSPNCVSPLPMPPSPSPSPQEEGEESSDGQASDDSANLTPPVGFCIASDGSVHGDMNMMGSMMADPMMVKDLLPKVMVMGKDMMVHPALQPLAQLSRSARQKPRPREAASAIPRRQARRTERVLALKLYRYS